MSDGHTGDDAAMRKNEETAAALLGVAEPGGAATSRFGSLCAEVRMARSGSGRCAAVACHVALNLLPRFLAHVQYRGPSEQLTCLSKSQRRRIDENRWKKADVTLVIGDEEPAPGSEALYMGSSGWSSYLSTERPCAWRPDASGNTLGAMMSGALAVGEVFKRLFADADPEPVTHIEYDLATHGTARRQPVLGPRVPSVVDLKRMALVGCGAIGQAVCFALAPFPLSGHVTLFDHDTVDDSNLQRYVLASRESVGLPKAAYLSRHLLQGSPALRCSPVPATFESYADFHASCIEYDTVVVCVDNVSTRVNVQGMLPRVIWNGWTDVSRHSLRYGVSRHVITGKYACIGCYYYPAGPEPTTMDMNSALTGLPAGRIRQLLDSNATCTEDIIQAVSKKSGIPLERLKANAGLPFRDMLHGRCGVFMMQRGEGPVTAPAPHQPLMAGIHLASQLVLSRCRGAPDSTLKIKSVSSFDAMKVPRADCLFNAAKDHRCFCVDKDYVDAYKAKWAGNALGRERRRWAAGGARSVRARRGWTRSGRRRPKGGEA